MCTPERADRARQAPGGAGTGCACEWESRRSADGRPPAPPRPYRWPQPRLEGMHPQEWVVRSGWPAKSIRRSVMTHPFRRRGRLGEDALGEVREHAVDGVVELFEAGQRLDDLRAAVAFYFDPHHRTQVQRDPDPRHERLLLRFVLPWAGRRRLGAASSGAARRLAVEATLDVTESRGESAERGGQHVEDVPLTLVDLGVDLFDAAPKRCPGAALAIFLATLAQDAAELADDGKNPVQDVDRVVVLWAASDGLRLGLALPGLGRVGSSCLASSVCLAFCCGPASGSAVAGLPRGLQRGQATAAPPVPISHTP